MSFLPFYYCSDFYSTNLNIIQLICINIQYYKIVTAFYSAKVILQEIFYFLA